MPYPNDPDVMRGEKTRYVVIDGAHGQRGGRLTQSDAIRVASDRTQQYRRKATAWQQKAAQAERDGRPTIAADYRKRAETSLEEARRVTIKEAS